MRRYATHLGSSKIREEAAVYDSLRALGVYTSDSISMSVSIVQGGQPINVNRETANVHIHEDTGKIRVYVPNDMGRQHICLSRELPIRLLKHIGARYLTTASELGAIITAPDLSSVDSLLQAAGIIEVDGIRRQAGEGRYYHDQSEEEEHTAESISVTPDTEPSDAYSRGTLLSYPEGFDDTISGPKASIPIRLAVPPRRPDLYKQLLGNLIQQAEVSGALFKPGLLTKAHVTIEWEDVDSSEAVTSLVSGEREFNIGAAGELYVSVICLNFSIKARYFMLKFSRFSSF